MKKPHRIIKYFLIILIFINASVWGVYFDNFNKNLLVSFFNVGQGDSALIKTPEKFKIVIDAGPDSKVLEHLGKSMGMAERKIDLFILTHPHEDHLFGALEILKRYDIDMVLTTGAIHTSDTYINFLQYIKENNIKIIIAKQGQIFKYGGLELEVLYPFENLSGKRVNDLNDSSIVLMVRYKNAKFLFTGDAGKDVGELLVNSGLNLKSDIFKVAHHGSKDGIQNFDKFLESANPMLAVISLGKNNFGHPHKETLKKLNNKSIRVLRTDNDGLITIETDGDNFWLVRQ